MDLNDIQFFQVKKKWKRSGGRKWEVTKSKLFEQKVNQIRTNAERINRKLKIA